MASLSRASGRETGLRSAWRFCTSVSPSSSVQPPQSKQVSPRCTRSTSTQWWQQSAPSPTRQGLALVNRVLTVTPAIPRALPKVGRGVERALQGAVGAAVRGGPWLQPWCPGSPLPRSPADPALLLTSASSRPRGESGVFGPLASPLHLDLGKAEPVSDLQAPSPPAHLPVLCVPSCPPPGICNDAVPFRGHAPPHLLPEPSGCLVHHRSHAGVRSL